MTLVQICRSLMRGEQIDGYTLQGNVFSDGNRFWKIKRTNDRFTILEEIPDPETIPFTHKQNSRHRSICRICGAEIVCEIHTTICRGCERKQRCETGEYPEKVCLVCGKVFYSNPHNLMSWSQRVCQMCRYKEQNSRYKKDWEERNKEKRKAQHRASYLARKINQNVGNVN